MFSTLEVSISLAWVCWAKSSLCIRVVTQLENPSQQEVGTWGFESSQGGARWARSRYARHVPVTLKPYCIHVLAVFL